MQLSTNSRIVIGANFLWAAANVFPFVAIFFFQDQFGFGPAAAGLSIALTSASSIGGTLTFNYLNRKRSPKQIFIFWAVIFAIAYSLAGVLYQFYIPVLILLMIGNFSLANITLVSKTIIIAVTTLQNRKKTFAYNLSAMNVARVFMPPLAVLIYSTRHANIRYLLIYNGLLVLCSGLLIHFKIGDVEHQVKDRNNSQNNRAIYKVNLLIPTFIALFMVVILIGQINFIIPQYTDSYISITVFSLTIFIYSACSAIFAPFVAKLTANINEIYNIISGLLLMAIALVIMQLDSAQVMIVVAVLYSLGNIQILTNIDTFYSRYLSGTELNHGLQINKLIVNTSKTFSPILLGAVIELYSIHVAIYVCTVIAIIGICALAIQKQVISKHVKIKH